MRKLSKTISQESANISVKETLINLLQKNRTEKVGGEGGRGEKISPCTVVNKEILQEEQEPSRQCNNLVKSSNDESSNKEEDDGTY